MNNQTALRELIDMRQKVQAIAGLNIQPRRPGSKAEKTRQYILRLADNRIAELDRHIEAAKAKVQNGNAA